ncbi:monofunctional biosynthetic peptidoglycan transglycosylase [Acinetobacter sp. ME22]|uniref:monofunctional biosynthetic peptidoglycan transglycosylase n=1 Tax=Acinetobacter sp. ME22 TaxID=2904802 RepID=UPI001EDA8760|nr:monofunctional biosynthetic peptidoglycan transglycosylase [Acinetobacter sp. ME22]MCG2572484.1 monofunctional biosynthetic peptidoglycan transglycosylase [Acinetobacter sp. ME22]
MKTLFMRIFLILMTLFLMIQLWIFASLLWWRTHPVERSMFMRIDAIQYPDETLQHKWRSYDQISNQFKHAVVAAEDGKFLHHHGFDFEGMQVALQRNAKADGIVAGGSTISQQLAKNLFLFNQRSFVRKGQEAIATFMMERLWSKQRILEVYMNSVELGANIYGVEAASRHYFHKSSKNLTREQAIFLAALLPNPRYYQEHPQDEKFRYRKRFIAKYIRYSQIPT